MSTYMYIKRYIKIYMYMYTHREIYICIKQDPLKLSQTSLVLFVPLLPTSCCIYLPIPSQLELPPCFPCFPLHIT